MFDHNHFLAGSLVHIEAVDMLGVVIKSCKFLCGCLGCGFFVSKSCVPSSNLEVQNLCLMHFRADMFGVLLLRLFDKCKTFPEK